MLTAIAAIIMEDGIRPWRPHTSDKATTIINKILAVAAGAVSVVFVVFAMNFGASIITVKSFQFMTITCCSTYKISTMHFSSLQLHDLMNREGWGPKRWE